MKKFYFLTLFLFVTILLNSMPNESALRVSIFRYLGNPPNYNEFTSFKNERFAAFERLMKSRKMKVQLISKLSNSIMVMINSRLNDYDCEAGDVFGIIMTPYGLPDGDEGYWMILRFTSITQYEWWCWEYYK